MWKKHQLRLDYQALVDEFIEYVKPLKEKYSIVLERSTPEAVCDFLGFIEHVEHEEIERLDAGHLYQYYEHLFSNLKGNVERWVKSVLSIPLELFLHFLYKTGKFPNGEWN